MQFNLHLDHHSKRGLRSAFQTFWSLPWGMIFIIFILIGIGLMTLYSAAGGSWQPWAAKQLVRFLIGFSMMLVISLASLRSLFRWAFWIYGLCFVMLIGVEVMGFVGMGARRWINLGFIQLQPSELMKVAIIPALARYFHQLSDIEVRTFWAPIIPFCLLLIPSLLILRQPDLGTTLMILMIGGAMIIVAGIHKFYLWVGGLAIVGLPPLAWPFLHTYQKKRVLTFLNPENDPLGSGYHVIQSKIALGSGGLFGKGFMQGSQSYLNFLPEKQTDFIFTMIGEEWGFAGAIFLLFLFGLLIGYGYRVAWRVHHQFGRLIVFGVTTSLFLYVFVNTAMVMGMLPVVGVPLPLISYGGTSLLTIMASFGLLFACDLQAHSRISSQRPGLF